MYRYALLGSSGPGFVFWIRGNGRQSRGRRDAQPYRARSETSQRSLFKASVLVVLSAWAQNPTQKYSPKSKMRLHDGNDTGQKQQNENNDKKNKIPFRPFLTRLCHIHDRRLKPVVHRVLHVKPLPNEKSPLQLPTVLTHPVTELVFFFLLLAVVVIPVIAAIVVVVIRLTPGTMRESSFATVSPAVGSIATVDISMADKRKGSGQGDR